MYILFFKDKSGSTTVCGLFSTKDKADAAAKERMKLFHQMECTEVHGWHSSSNVALKEYFYYNSGVTVGYKYWVLDRMLLAGEFKDI